jgi:hypothetical protein
VKIYSIGLCIIISGLVHAASLRGAQEQDRGFTENDWIAWCQVQSDNGAPSCEPYFPGWSPGKKEDSVKREARNRGIGIFRQELSWWIKRGLHGTNLGSNGE